MKYALARLQDDGRFAHVTPARLFDTVDELKKFAPDALVGKRGGGRLVIVRFEELVIPTTSIRYEKFDSAGVRHAKAP